MEASLGQPHEYIQALGSGVCLALNDLSTHNSSVSSLALSLNGKSMTQKQYRRQPTQDDRQTSQQNWQFTCSEVSLKTQSYEQITNAQFCAHCTVQLGLQVKFTLYQLSTEWAKWNSNTDDTMASHQSYHNSVDKEIPFHCILKNTHYNYISVQQSPQNHSLCCSAPVTPQSFGTQPWTTAGRGKGQLPYHGNVEVFCVAKKLQIYCTRESLDADAVDLHIVNKAIQNVPKCTILTAEAKKFFERGTPSPEHSLNTQYPSWPPLPPGKILWAPMCSTYSPHLITVSMNLLPL